MEGDFSPDARDPSAENIFYTCTGQAVYTDPTTRFTYLWDPNKNLWLPKNTDGTPNMGPTLYETEFYRWSKEQNAWVLKEEATETEFYKWDVSKKEWVLKANMKFHQPTPPPSPIQNNAPKVTYDIDEDGNRTYTDPDGSVFFWDTEKNAWFPKIDDDFLARYQMNYGFIDNTSAAVEEKRLKEEQDEQQKALELQRMTEEAKAADESDSMETAQTSKAAGMKRKANAEPPKWFEMDPAHNTKVYVSNLPLDITLDEFAELMGKCGMIMRDPQTQKYKLKLYAERDGQLKGDGLCDYIKVESVDLALKILDEYDVRGHKIKVQRAKFEMRGEYNPALKPKRKKKDKEKLAKMKEKLFDWRPEKMRGERSKNEKIVIIKNLFDPSIFEKEVQLILDYQNDVREECTKCGTVRKVVIYDRHSEGVAQVNMASPEEADLVIQMMHGRFFGQRKLSAEHWDGKTKYKIVESETEVQKRLNNWDQFLENEEEQKAQKAEDKSAKEYTEVKVETQNSSMQKHAKEADVEDNMDIVVGKAVDSNAEKSTPVSISTSSEFEAKEDSRSSTAAGSKETKENDETESLPTDENVITSKEKHCEGEAENVAIKPAEEITTSEDNVIQEDLQHDISKDETITVIAENAIDQPET